jgi:hypothetical protein
MSEFEWEARVRSAVCFGTTFVSTGKWHAVSRSYGTILAEYLQLNDTSGVTFRNDNCKRVVSCQECASGTVKLHGKTAALGFGNLREWAAWLIFRRSHPALLDSENGGSSFFWISLKITYLKLAYVHQNRIYINNALVEVRFFAHVHTGPGVHPASCTMGTGSFPGVKRPGGGADHPPLLAPRGTKG